MDSKTPSSRRRGFILGAAATGAAATAVVALPLVQQQAGEPTATEQPKPERGGGYRVSEHIERYYKTTRF